MKLGGGCCDPSMLSYFRSQRAMLSYRDESQINEVVSSVCGQLNATPEVFALMNVAHVLS